MTKNLLDEIADMVGGEDKALVKKDIKCQISDFTNDA